MIVLTIRTDKPEAELGIYDSEKQLAYETWQAHRELGITIHKKIDELLGRAGRKLEDVQGIACFKGPGSFTGLRIGLTVGNALAYALNVPIVACEDPLWLEHGIADLLSGQDEKIVTPEYGSEAHITSPKK